MACSLKQAEANKKNAMASTGPRTPLGKSIARRNSLKHGLTGEGIVLPHEDVEELDRRFTTLDAEMKPGSELARGLVSRIALMMIRLDRSAEHEAKTIAHKMRKAQAEFDDARLAEMENYYSWIAAEPATNARRLRKSPEGINRLRNVLEDLRSDLAQPEGHRWDWQRCEQLHYVLGLRPCDVPVSRARALNDAIEGNFRNLNLADGGDLDPIDRRQWAVRALVDLIDGEIGKLQALWDNFDHEGLELDRAEAVQRAIFDASKEAVLARKYEAASERGFYRALKEFREAQAIPAQVVESPPLATDPPDEMGSFLPETSEPDLESADADIAVVPVPISVPDQPVSRRSTRRDRARTGRKGRSGPV